MLALQKVKNPGASQRLDQAFAFLGEGNAQGAVALCREVLASFPRDIDALHLLGVALVQLGQFADAAEALQAAAQSRPSEPTLRNSLGIALKEAGRLEDAEKALRRALKLRTAFPEALANLGRVLLKLGRTAEAEQVLRRALAFGEKNAYALSAHGMVLRVLGRVDEARQSFAQAFKINPGLVQQACQRGMLQLSMGRALDAEEYFHEALALNEACVPAYNGLALAAWKQGRMEEAERAFHRALAIAPEEILPRINLASLLLELGRFEEAERACRLAVKLDPNLAVAHDTLAIALAKLGRSQDAEQSWRQALSLEPNSAQTHANLAKLLMDGGRVEEAERSFRRATELAPDWFMPAQMVAFLQNYIPGRSPAAIRGAHIRFAERFLPAAPERDFANVPDGERRLRIGYISPDFRQHSVAWFIEPVLAAHDRTQFEVHCYSNHARSDAVTERLKRLSDHWRDISSMSDEQVVASIAEDGVDVLVDLSGHTVGNRLCVLASRAAPLQGTWLGYPTATGCRAIDFRITDRQVDESADETLPFEMASRLPSSYFCYGPPPEAPDPGPLPASQAGHITFGSFNALMKLNPAVVALWCRVLRQVQNARLVLKAKGLGDPDVRARLTEWFALQEVAVDRVSLLDWAASTTDHLSAYPSVDVALDTYPYNGATTTCEALWMGVPVVSLYGDTHASRMGKSILHAAGLGHLACVDEETFVLTAVRLCADLTTLASLRQNLRRRIATSSLTDAAAFIRGLEAGYRELWKAWCRKHHAEPGAG